MNKKVTLLQSNLQHSKGATSLIGHYIAMGQTSIYLLQKPWSDKGQIKDLGSMESSLYYKRDNYVNPRTCIYVNRQIEAYLKAQFCCRDLVAFKLVLKNEEGQDKPIVVSLAYLSYDSAEDLPTRELVELVEYCQREGLHLLVGCDANAHHTVWGSTDINRRGAHLLEYLTSTNLRILNRGRKT